jgi:hypothetical protein
MVEYAPRLGLRGKQAGAVTASGNVRKATGITAARPRPTKSRRAEPRAQALTADTRLNRLNVKRNLALCWEAEMEAPASYQILTRQIGLTDETP